MTRSRYAIVAAALLASAVTRADAATFTRADSNDDGVVTFEEARNIHFDMTGVWFRKFDWDGDGVLDEREFHAFSAFADVMLEGW